MDSQGRKQSQGYLQVMLHDRVVGHDILVVTTHLKAKEGVKEEDVRLRQVSNKKMLYAGVPHSSRNTEAILVRFFITGACVTAE